MMLFELSPPEGYSVSSKCYGRNFIFDDRSSPVLDNRENFTCWSDDLTALHEEAAGDSRLKSAAEQTRTFSEACK
jgi:hypothetical protein